MRKLATTGSVHSEMLQTEKGRRKGTQSAQRDKPLDEAPGLYRAHVAIYTSTAVSTKPYKATTIVSYVAAATSAELPRLCREWEVRDL